MEKKVAKELLKVKAVMLNTETPFKWASGWNSPIYCDNRKVLSFPQSRKIIVEALVEVISAHYEDCDLIAGVATGAIAWGAMVAEALDKPFVYVRPTAKDHGTGARIEGEVEENAKVVVVEDLISTGQSSISAANALSSAGANVVGMVAIFSYNFAQSRRSFEYENLELRTLSNYDALIEEALASNYITIDDIEALKEWRFNPESWGK